MRQACFFRFLPLLAILFLAACAGERGGRLAPVSGEPTGYYKIGQPYQIKGVWYYPKEDYAYDESGIASWYGADFHRQLTANGEVYNKNELTAAHRTLPMPSLARVTNLENGRAIVVRVNDRGPFSRGRIIDVSQRAAQLLGFEGQGTAKVRVQVLADESKAIAEAMRRYGHSLDDKGRVEVASAAPPPVPPRLSAASSPERPRLDEPVEARPLPAAPESPLPSLATVRPVPEYTQGPVPARSDIFIQAGAFTRKDYATRLQGKLAKLGKTSVVPATVKGVLYHRVRLGPIPNVAEADALLQKVLKSGADGARIIVVD